MMQCWVSCPQSWTYKYTALLYVYFVLCWVLIMAPRSIMIILIPLFFIVGILSPGQAIGFGIRNCCTRYSNKVVVLEHIKGYQEQIALEFCRINAIIFYTTSNQRVCANPEDEWVKKTLKSLRQKIKL
ncbi:hypothetical protein XENORESO_021707 [Xenotaenia resolanae]|uniref:Chemokine interleukin-8-like domain-containing protein n=1 Tax=Xenotaenia resolanae TaxID=208358 RepID=A0ABV0WH10_9TELE